MSTAHVPMLPELRALVSSSLLATYSTTVVVLSTVYLLYVVVNKVLYYLSSPIRDLPGPKSVSWLTGSLARREWEPDSQKFQLEWARQYGPVVKYYGWFNMTRVITTDLKALNYVLTAPEFEKPPEGRQFLGDIVGRGLLFVEGLKHKQQRKIMSPAFGLPQIKEYSQLFIETANEMRDILMTQTAQSRESEGSLRLDIYLWLNKTTLDIIGLAGFNHSFRSLHQDGSHMVTEGFCKFSTFDPFSVTFMLPALFPPARLIPTDRSRALSSTRKALRSIGEGLISQKKAELLATTWTESNPDGGVEKKSVQGRDLLSLLIKANMATDLPDRSRMTDEEILSQVPTFLLAGHETTSTAVAWALYALACHPAACAKLNAEARAFHTDAPSMDDLNGMTYLDCVIREVLRLHAPVSNTERVAKCDVMVPLSEPFIDRHGVKRHEFRQRKGSTIMVPILAVHKLKSLWGDDAEEFRPERWECIPDAVKAMPSVFGNLLTFITGPHACIGYRFALVEMKAILFSFVRSFDFELGVPPTEITRKTMLVARPFLTSDPESGPQLPLVIRPTKCE